MALTSDKELKTYFSIREVADMFGVNASTLRFWETKFPTLKPRVANRNVRQYTQEDIEEVRLIHNLVKVRGLHISTAVSVIKKTRNEATATTDLIEKLEAIRAELVSFRKELEGLV